MNDNEMNYDLKKQEELPIKKESKLTTKHRLEDLLEEKKVREINKEEWDI